MASDEANKPKVIGSHGPNRFDQTRTDRTGERAGKVIVKVGGAAGRHRRG